MNTVYTILTDTRERKPLIFPHHLTVLDPAARPGTERGRTVRLVSVKQKLETGDYGLKGHLDRTIIERKGSLREVAKNCLTHDRGRFVRELARLRDECRTPIVLLEGNPVDLLRPSKTVPQPELALDALHRLLIEYGVQLLLLPRSTFNQRQALGTWAAHLLLNGVLIHAPTNLH